MLVIRRRKLSSRLLSAMAMVALFISGCSKPEEVISARMAQATKHLEAGEVTDGLRILEDLNERFPDRPAVLEALGFAYVQTGRPTAGAAALVKAADQDPASSSLRPLAAEAYLKDGAPEKAAEQLRLYVNEFPGDFQVWQRLGEAEELQGNTARAIDAYVEWYRIRPGADAAFLLGTAFRRLNNIPQARTWFELALRHADSKVDGALAGLLAIEIETQDYAAAELTLGQLERNFPAILPTLPDLPDYRAEIARWRETRSAVDAARADQARLADELAASRREQQASLPIAPPHTPPPAPLPSATPPPAPLPQLPAPPAPPPAPSFADVPASEDPELTAALARKEAGDLAGAAELLQTAISYNESNIDLWVELADCLRRLKQHHAAEAYLLEARRREPESLAIEFAYLNLGREYLPHEGYLARLDQARKRFPTNTNLAYQLAHEYATAQVDRHRTAAAYEDFLLLAPPDDPRRKEAETFLNRSARR